MISIKNLTSLKDTRLEWQSHAETLCRLRLMSNLHPNQRCEGLITVERAD